jgi:hypothetical protein
MPSLEHTLSAHRRAWGAPPLLADEDDPDSL